MRTLTIRMLEVGDRVHMRHEGLSGGTSGVIEQIGTVTPGRFEKPQQNVLVAGKWRWLTDPTMNDAGQIEVTELAG